MRAAIAEKELESFASTVSMEGYRRAPRADRPKILEWVATLQQMSDEDFVIECSLRILDSAIMNGYRGNSWGVHVRADICADEADRRHRLAGHAPDCREANLYSKGLNEALRSQRHPIQSLASCTCGKER